jgi:hypothetical protein
VEILEAGVCDGELALTLGLSISEIGSIAEPRLVALADGPHSAFATQLLECIRAGRTFE